VHSFDRRRKIAELYINDLAGAEFKMPNFTGFSSAAC
jgi:hypothetical protein